MNRLVRAIVGCLIPLVGIACGEAPERAGAPPAGDTAATAAAAGRDTPQRTSPEYPPGTAYLVWSADSTGAQTAWVGDDGSAAATRAEVVIAADARLWAWRQSQDRARGTDCECSKRHDYEEADICPTTDTVPVVALVNLGSGRRLRVLGVPDPAPPATAPLKQGVVPIGSVGPYLFTEQWSHGYFCGANKGYSQVAFSVYHLAGDELRPVHLVTGDTMKLLADEVGRARTAFLETEAQSGPTGDIELSSVEPRWTAEGGLQVGYRFGADACGACGDEHSGSYRQSRRVDGPLPALLAPWRTAPEPVRRYWARHPPPEHAGWSAVAAGEARQALARFKAP